MKKIILYIIMLSTMLLMSFHAGCGNSALNQKRWVTAREGLHIRSEPSLEGKIAGLIPYGTGVSVKEKSEHTTRVFDKDTSMMLEDHWYRVSYRGKEGWAYGGYLQSHEEFLRQRHGDLVCSVIADPFSPDDWFERYMREGGTPLVNAITSKFGKPVNENSTPVPNRHHPERTDRIITLTYDEFKFTVYHASEFDKELMKKIQFTGNFSQFGDGISGESTSRSIKKYFGKPFHREKRVYSYICSRGPTDDILSFHFEKGRLDKVVVEYTLD